MLLHCGRVDLNLGREEAVSANRMLKLVQATLVHLDRSNNNYIRITYLVAHASEVSSGGRCAHSVGGGHGVCARVSFFRL